MASISEQIDKLTGEISSLEIQKAEASANYDGYRNRIAELVQRLKKTTLSRDSRKKANSALADAKDKAAYWLGQLNSKAGAITAKNNEILGLQKQRDEEAKAAVELAKKGETTMSKQIQAEGISKAIQIEAKAKADAVTKQAEATAKTTETSSKSKNLVFVLIGLVVFALIAVTVYKKIKK